MWINIIYQFSLSSFHFNAVADNIIDFAYTPNEVKLIDKNDLLLNYINGQIIPINVLYADCLHSDNINITYNILQTNLIF